MYDYDATLQASNLGLQAYIIGVKNKLINTQQLNDIKQRSTALQNKSAELVESMALNTNVTKKLVGNDYLSSQIYTDDYVDDNEFLLADGLSVLNITSCLKQLKQFYNFTEDDKLIIIKTDSDPLLNDDSDSSVSAKEVKFDIYSKKDKKKLNISLCDQNNIEIKLPIDNKFYINTTKYNLLKEQGIDIFNPNDPYFTSRCYSYSPDGFDTTVKMRMKDLYTNISISCNDDCTYNGIDENNYVRCDCPLVMNSPKFRSKWKKFVLKQLLSLNFGIIMCPNRVFNVKLL
jgi:hypothetical protein